MLSVMRHVPPTVSSSSVRSYGYRFLEENLQTKRRRKALQNVVVVRTPLIPVIKKHPFQEFTKNMQEFFSLMETKFLQDFLNCDKCFKVSDNYALSMVFIYFIRAEFTLQEYTKENFFVALYLSLDMEDDEEEFKFELFPWCLGENWKKTYPLFLQCRDRLWKRINYRALCSKATCDEIMSIIPSPLWRRIRDENHGGAIRKYRKPKHPNNDLPVGPFGTPIPCVHCLLYRKEEENWTFLKAATTLSSGERSNSSSGSKVSEEADFFYTADESLSATSRDSLGLFSNSKQPSEEADVSFLESNLSSGYRDRSAFATESDDDDEVIWQDAAPVVADIFSFSDDDDDAGGTYTVQVKSNSSNQNDNHLSDIFSWDSSDESSLTDKRSETQREPRRAQRSFSHIDLRDSEAPTKRLSSELDLFQTEA